MFETYDIIVTNKKRELISKRELYSLKIYTLKEFVNKLYCSYDVKAIYYVMSKYNVIGDVAKIYLDNIRYIDDKEYKSSKLNFLKRLKDELQREGLLSENTLFKKYLGNKRILFYDIGKTKELSKLTYNIEFMSMNNKKYKHKIYVLKTLEDEIVFVANKICELIESGIDVKRICLVNIDEEYRKVIRRVFPMFNIRCNLKTEDTIFGTFFVRKFLELYDNDMEKVLDELRAYINNDEDQELFDSIVRVINKYVDFDDYISIKELVKADLKRVIKPHKEYLNAVRECDDHDFIDDEYVFMLNFNQGVIPRVYKDEEFLSDNDKEELGISLTVDKNILERNQVIEYINNTKNLIITCKEYYNGEDYKVANINEELGFDVIRSDERISRYSNLYNKLYLASLKDLYNKYGSVSKEMNMLDNYYKSFGYNSYNNEFTGIDKEELCEYIDNKVVLSYSSLDKYFRCPFSYYLDKILKINVFEDSFYQVIGILFHTTLQRYFDKEGTFDDIWGQELELLKDKLSSKDFFFLVKLKKELEFVIETIEYQETITDLHDELHEEKIYVSLDGKAGVKFTGVIDKIKYKEEAGETIVALIDYKTGNADVDLTMLPYGIGLQLPAYIFLAKNNKRFKNVKIAGFYLQKILNNEESNNDDNDYEGMKRKRLLLQGYSNADINVLSSMDSSYEDSNLIKGMKVKKDGDFSAYSKVLTDGEMSTIESIVVEKINEGADGILGASFAIAPKRVENKNISCVFCNYKDICYKKNEDIVELDRLTIEEVLGGEKDGVDERTGIGD